MSGAEVEVLPLPVHVERALMWWRGNPMLPASYVKNNKVDVEGMRRAAFLLFKVDVDVEAWLGDTFVIKDQVGFKADLQRHLLTRPGTGYDFEILEVDDEHCTARIMTPTGWKPPLTKRFTDNDIQAYARRGAKDGEEYNENYRDKRRRMLLARVSTELVDLYAKGVLRGIVAQADAGVEYAEGDGETPPAVAAAVKYPPRSFAPDGSTIPEYLREVEVSDAERADLRRRLDVLQTEQPEAFAAVLDRWKQKRRPALSSHNFTESHGELLEYFVADAILAVAAERHPSGGAADVVPDHVYDSEPEANVHEEGTYRYDPEDGRPM